MLPVDIAANYLFQVDHDFNARFDATSRSYEYLLCYDKNPFLNDFSCFYPYPELSIEKLNEASKFLAEQTDFASFSKKRTQVKTTLCKITHAQWQLDPGKRIVRFNITADRFLRGMVRGIVATSLRYAREKISMEMLQAITESKQPHKTDFSAPAQGLTLTSVTYPEGFLGMIEG